MTVSVLLEQPCNKSRMVPSSLLQVVNSLCQNLLEQAIQTQLVNSLWTDFQFFTGPAVTLFICTALEKRTQQPGKQKVSKVSGKATVVKGLANLGNTCFFNSVMQVLKASTLKYRTCDAVVQFFFVLPANMVTIYITSHRKIYYQVVLWYGTTFFR